MNSYVDCQKVIATARCRSDGKPLGNNTYLVDRSDSFAVRLHTTDVISFYPDGSIVLDSGGWETVTTKSRMNEYLPTEWYVYQESGVWYLRHFTPGKIPRNLIYIFHDGIKIGPRGGCDSKRRKGN